MTMACSLPDNFCIYYSLKNGGKFIAGLCILTSIISSILITSYLFSDPNEIAKEIANNDGMVETLEENGLSARICAGLVLVLSIVLLVSSVLLIKGIDNKSRQLFIPFLGTLSVTIFFLLIISFIQFEREPFFAVLSLIVVFIYFMICIYSLYSTLDNSRCDQTTDIHLNQHYAS